MSVNLSDNSYLGLKVEAIEGTAVKPDKFIPLISESIKTNPNHVADRRMKGNPFKSDDILRGERSHEGDIVIFSDANNVGHLINMVLKKGVTTGDATNGYTHPFTVGDPKTYTIEVGKGIYAQRYFGVKGENLRFEFVDGKMQATLSIKAMGQFSVGALSEALTGAGMVSLKLNQEYDLNPNTGLCVGDVVTVGGEDLTVLTVDPDGVTVTFTSATVTASIGDPVRLKKQTPSYANLIEPLFLGNTLVGVGADETAATISAGAKATAIPTYSLVWNKLANLLSAPASGSMDPIQLLPQTKEGEITISRLMESEVQHLDWLNRVKQAITIIATGKAIGIGVETLTWRFYKVKLITNEEPLEVGAYIFDNQTFEILYDTSDAKAMTVELVNRVIGTDYE